MVGLAACAVMVSACSGGAPKADPAPGSSAAGSSVPGTPTGHGSVDVLYAGSLTHTMESAVGPAFHAATGYDLAGIAGGSSALASEIAGGVRQADVFISASPAVDAKLMGPHGKVSWYATFAHSPLVIGYDPHSRFAHDLETNPWYQVMTEPGFRLGRTDPALDPKGKLTVQVVDRASQHYGLPQLAAHILGPPSSTAQLFPEEGLIGRLQAGQLDAGFFYSTETSAAHLPAIPINPAVDLSAHYTITIPAQPPHPEAAGAFVNFFLGPKGRSILAQGGLSVDQPVVTGNASDVPAGVTVLGP